jgi:hypothetical protein
VAAKVEPAKPKRAAGATADLRRSTTHAAPVFVDASGKRRRWVRRGSIATVSVLTAYGIVVALSFLGGPVPPNALLPLPGVPGATTPPDGATSPAVAVGGATTTASASAGRTPNLAGGAGSALSPKPSASASGSASPSSSRRVPPGLAGKSASPGSGNGHGH